MSFTDKVVVVTGASSGIGAATAIMFCKEGASVVLVGRNEAKLKIVSEQCTKAGGKHIVIKADVAKDDDAKRIFKDTIKKFGKLDVLVNNAGILSYGSILAGTILESYDKILPINLRAVVHLTTLAAPHLIKTKGNIINISSITGQKSLSPMITAYGISKAGLDHLTRGSALELASSGVRVNAISPGPVETDLLTNAGPNSDFDGSSVETPLGRKSKSEEIGDLILFLASDRAKGITGSIFVSDNGYMVK